MFAGLLSSLFLSAGLSHAAQRLDPLNLAAAKTDTGTAAAGPTSPCALPSYYMPLQSSVDVRSFGR